MMRNNRYAWWLAGALALAFAPRTGMAQVAQPVSAKDEVHYAGADVCAGCHEAAAASIGKSLHGKTTDPRTPASAHGCESCHGPAAKHAEDPEATKPRQFKKMTPDEASATCTSCHATGKHAMWAGSKHDARGIACTSCHIVHNPKGPALVKTETQGQLCASCHQNIVSKMSRFNHMPVREGAMVCSSCHNTHGSSNVKLLKTGTTIDQACTGCHNEKRGPMLWEHAPVANSCTTCHDAHGSSNDRMLVAKAPFLCQRCHVTSRHPPTIYNGYTINTTSNANKLTGRNCMICHTQIHGSNSPNGKALLR
jgi:DmsE family decaheme c-type cytochrome